MQKNGTKPDTTRQAQEYTQGWYDMMVRIWTDKIQLHGIYDTGALRSSVAKAALSLDEMSFTAAFRFLNYGVYVDAGTGNGYTRGNGGYLEIMDKAVRYERGLKKKRKRRRWFSPSWAISCRVIADQMQKLAGDRFVGLFDNLAD